MAQSKTDALSAEAQALSTIFHHVSVETQQQIAKLAKELDVEVTTSLTSMQKMALLVKAAPIPWRPRIPIKTLEVYFVPIGSNKSSARNLVDAYLKDQKALDRAIRTGTLGEKRIARQARASVVRKLHEQGLGSVAIAKKLNTHNTTIATIKRDIGIDTPSTKALERIQVIAANLEGTCVAINQLSRTLQNSEIDLQPPHEVKKCQAKLTQALTSIRSLLKFMSRARRPETAGSSIPAR